MENNIASPKVTPEIETIAGEPGAVVWLDDVLLVGDDAETRIGTPTVEGASVSAIVNHGKGRKVIVFKFRRRKNYKRKNGHRQNLRGSVLTASR